MTHSWRRTVESPEQLGALVYELGNMRQPFTVTVQRGKGRSMDQSALAWKWAAEIAAHFGDRTKNEIWAEMKLEIGVPLLREHDPEFREVYDKHIKPLTYEAKLALMQPPIDFPITRQMLAPVMSLFMDQVLQRWTREGVFLTKPEDGQ